MANNAVKTPIFRAIANRSYSSQKTNPIYGIINDIKTTVLPNKLVVASADTGSPITRLSVAYRAGSRYETTDNRGVTHAIRIAAGLSTKNATQFSITRHIQQLGANLTCTTDREMISYTLTGTQNAVERTSEYLSEIVSQQVFKPWEIQDSLPRMKLELASMQPEVKVVNLLHRAAFRRGLGNSLFCAKHQIGKISTETLQHYVAENFTTNRAAVLGLGVDHQLLVAYAQNIPLESGSGGKVTESKYFGGELRSEKGGKLAYVAIGAQGAAMNNYKEVLAFAVLQYAMGIGAYIKRGNEASSLLFKAVSSAAGEKPFAISAINASYSDNGLFGFVAVAPRSISCEILVKATNALMSGEISDADVKRAKNQLKMAMLLIGENGSSFIEAMGHQALFLDSVQTPEEIVASIDGVTTADVQQAAQKVASGKLSMAAIGNLQRVPYLDELH